MRWQVAHFVFCDQQQTLSSDFGTQQLEPILVELLSYFCQNQDAIISKDELIERVWLGRIVSDNAVAKTVTKLRKALTDDARQPKFIATFPKKGYKFIGGAVLLSDNSAAPVEDVKVVSTKSTITPSIAASQQTQLKLSKSIGFWLIALVAISALMWAGYRLVDRNLANKVVFTSAKALTTDAGDELFPSFSPDGSRLAYMVAKQDRMHLRVKNVLNENVVEISHQSNFGVGPADWSQDGRYLVYLVATSQHCQYFIREVTDLDFSEPQLIHECPAGSYGKIIFTHDNHRLVYAESAGNGSPYVMYELNTRTQTTKRLNQPDLFIGGNSQFDLHPIENKLLISSPNKQQWEGFYALDLDTQELSLLFSQDAYICCGIWSHDGNRVILMGEHPAFQLLSYDLTGKDKTVIYAGSRIIRLPRRHINGIDYVFTSGQSNVDFSLLQLELKQQKIIAQDSVNELLATFAHHSDQIAYVSLASGNEEIWLTDSVNTKRKKLTHFNDARHYIDLVWSPSGNHLLALTLNGLHLINTSTGEYQQLAIQQTEIRGVSFKSESTIAFSIREGQRWRVFNYQLNEHRVVPEDPRWQYIQYRPDMDNTLWLDQQEQMFFGAAKQSVSAEQIPTHSLLNGRQFNLKKRGEGWFWFARDKSNSLMWYSEQTKVTTPILETNVAHFDVRDDAILFGHLREVNSDLYQTQKAY